MNFKLNLILYILYFFEIFSFSKNSNETLNVTNNFEFSLFYLNHAIESHESTCNDLCSDTSDFKQKTCECDKCEIFDDCCQDMQKPILEKMYECKIRVGNNQWVYSISKCPINFSDLNIRYNCEKDEEVKILNLLPVYSEKTNLTYKNIYCANCNIENRYYRLR